MGQGRTIRPFWLVVSIAVSFALGFALSRMLTDEFSFDNRISLADVTTIIATSLVTVFAAWYLSKKLNEDRYAKEMHIEDLKKIEESISSVIDKAQQIQETTGTQDDITDIVTKVNHLHTLLQRLKRTSRIHNKDIEMNSVTNSFLCFYGCATNYSDTSPNLSLVMSYGDDLIVEIRKTISNINKL